MNRTEHTDSIFQCPLCAAVPQQRRPSFLQDMKYSIKHYEKEEVILNRGARYDTLYILIEGEIVTEMTDEKGDFMKVEQIGAPNPLATGFLFATENLSPVTAIASQQCVILAIPRENVYFLMRKYEEFMKAFLLHISNKLAFLSEKLRLVSLRTIRAKIAYYLLKESKGAPCFRLKTSKEELAHLFGVSRPALVKVLMEMAAEGIIEVNGREIRINRPWALQKIL